MVLWLSYNLYPSSPLDPLFSQTKVEKLFAYSYTLCLQRLIYDFKVGLKCDDI